MFRPVDQTRTAPMRVSTDATDLCSRRVDGKRFPKRFTEQELATCAEFYKVALAGIVTSVDTIVDAHCINHDAGGADG